MIAFTTDTLSDSITMRDPEFGDDEKVDLNLTTHIMRSGKMRTVRQDIVRTFDLHFKDLTRARAEIVKDFFMTYAGQTLRYFDYEGSTWRGKVLNNPIEVITTDRGLASSPGQRAESNAINIEFEGTKL